MIGWQILRHDRIRANHGTVANLNARCDDRAVADPYIVTDDHALLLTACPELAINAQITKIFIRSITDFMSREPLHRVFESIDANIRSN